MPQRAGKKLYFLVSRPSMIPVVRAAQDVISPAVYSPRRPPPTRGTQNMYAGICRNRGEISRQGDIDLWKAITTLYNWPVAKVGRATPRPMVSRVSWHIAQSPNVNSCLIHLYVYTLSLAQCGSTGAIVVSILGLSESDTARKPRLEGCRGAWDGWASQGCQGALAGAEEVVVGSDRWPEIQEVRQY